MVRMLDWRFDGLGQALWACMDSPDARSGQNSNDAGTLSPPSASLQTRRLCLDAICQKRSLNMVRLMQLINTYRGPDTHHVAKARFVACGIYRGWLKQALSNPQGTSRGLRSAMPSKPLLSFDEICFYKSAIHFRRSLNHSIEPSLSLYQIQFDEVILYTWRNNNMDSDLSPMVLPPVQSQSVSV